MNAITYHHFGPSDVLQLQTVPQPSHSEHTVIVRVRATSVNVLDSRVRDGKMGILTSPVWWKAWGAE